MIILKKLYKAWIHIGNKILFFNTSVILTIIFFGFLTPLATIRRFFSESPLKLNIDVKSTTYTRTSTNRNPDHFNLQF